MLLGAFKMKSWWHRTLSCRKSWFLFFADFLTFYSLSWQALLLLKALYLSIFYINIILPSLSVKRTPTSMPVYLTVPSFRVWLPPESISFHLDIPLSILLSLFHLSYTYLYYLRCLYWRYALFVCYEVSPCNSPSLTPQFWIFSFQFHINAFFSFPAFLLLPMTSSAYLLQSQLLYSGLNSTSS